MIPKIEKKCQGNPWQNALKNVIQLDEKNEGQNMLQVFKDESKISAYARDGVENVYHYGILKGKDGGIFAPNEKATRAEAAAVMYKLLMLRL